MLRRSFYFLALSFSLLSACHPGEGEVITETKPLNNPEVFDGILNLPENLHNYASINLPPHFNAPVVREADNTPYSNQISDEGALLGRVLFYDKKLSQNNSIACASCHTQETAFSDSRQFSVGFEGELTGRNSMGLSNSRFYENGRFFWDERASSLEEQTLMPIQDHVEMGMTLDELEAKLQVEDYYKVLFYEAFGDSTVHREKIAEALAQFVRSMVSYQSKYDEGLAQGGRRPRPNEPVPGFSQLENQGRALFFDPQRGGCAGCHRTDLFIGERAFNNGLDATTTDEGLAAVTGRAQDEGKFKVPSLRNIELTAPYMHDGRFATLEEVVEHYNSGVERHPNLDNRLRRNNSNEPRRLNLTSQEKSALVAFMKTLTDQELIADEKFSDPFIH